MNSKALLEENSFSDSNFNSSAFEQKFSKGWLKIYYFGVLVILLANLGNAFNNLKNGITFMGNPIIKDLNYNGKGGWDGTFTYYNTVFYGVSLLLLAGIALIFAFSLFLQFQAMRLRSLRKQELCIKIGNFFILAQVCAAGVNVFLIFISGFLFMKFALNILIFLIIGVGFRLFASKVQNIMLSKVSE